MHRRRRTLVELLTRSLAASGFVYAMVLAYVLPAALLNQQPVQPHPRRHAVDYIRRLSRGRKRNSNSIPATNPPM